MANFRDVNIFSDETMLLHDAGPGHPERPDRLRAIQSALASLSTRNIHRVAPTANAVGRIDIERVHDSRYIDWIDSLRGRAARLDADTTVSPNTVECAYLAAAAAIQAATRVVETENTTAFALVRPPGHHAERDRAMGFCYFNNIAVAAAHAIDQLRCKRVLIIDWDVHHGNGTQHIFESRNDVLFFSAHQWPLYPGMGSLHEIGTGDGEGFTANAPLPAQFGDPGYVHLFQRLLVPIARAYQPDLILVSAGFDAHRDDPLGSMAVTAQGFAALCTIVRDLADEVAGGKLALILEGGYDLHALANSVRDCVEVLAGASVIMADEPSSHEASVVDRLCAFHAAHWRL